MGRLFSNPKVTAAAVIALAIGLISVAGGALGASLGGGFLGGPLPEVSLPAEAVAHIGGYALNNTTLMFWAAGLILVLLSWLATRNIGDVPGRLQTMFEVIFQFFGEMAEGSAGKAGRQFIAISTLIFLIVLGSNWLGILPGVGTIGHVETVQEYVHHHAEDHTSDIRKADPGLTDQQVEAVATLETVMSADVTFTVFNGGSLLTLPIGRGEAGRAPISAIVTVDNAEMQAIIDEIEQHHTAIEDLPTAHREAFEQVESQLAAGIVQRSWVDTNGDSHDLTGQKVGFLIPYLRGSSTDVNTTLAVAIFAMVGVQVFGFRALGLKGYGGKFINIKQGPIYFAVGLLEIFGEFARTISFTFRLFGNMFAGEILLVAMGFLFPLIGIIPFLGLELFVGVIQAFIFGALTLVFASLAVSSHGDHEEHESTEGQGAH